MNSTPQQIRLVYISKATFKPFHTSEGMECHVAQILSTSRQNNQKNHLFGALYYGNSNFFQCLEGEKTAVEALLAKIRHDTRHSDLKVLYEEPIEQLSFKNWEMKYAMLDQQARDFLRHYKLHRFDPYQFDLKMVQQFVEILQASKQEVSETAVKKAAERAIPKTSFVQEKGALLLGVFVLLFVLALTVLFLT